MNRSLEIFGLVILISLMPLIFQNSYSEKLPEESNEECTRQSSSDHSNNHVLRMLQLRDCFKQEAEQRHGSLRIQNFNEDIINYCDNLYPIYQAVDEPTYYTFAKKFGRNCILLYHAPMYNSTDIDRPQVLHDFVELQIIEHMEKTKDQRIKSVENARLTYPVIMQVHDMFSLQLEKIESLEKQLHEQNIPIPSSSEIKLKEDTLINCLLALNDKSIHTVHKIAPLKECAEVDHLVGVGIDATEIIKSKAKKISGNFLSFCEYTYPMYQVLSLQDYYDSVKHPFTRYCPFLFEDPIWSYEDSDRNQVLTDFIVEKIKEQLSQSDDFRKKSVSEAVINTGRLMILKDLYELQNQKIELLQSELEK